MPSPVGRETFGPESTGYAVYLTDAEVSTLKALEAHLTRCMLEDADQRKGLHVLSCVLKEIVTKEFLLD